MQLGVGKLSNYIGQAEDEKKLDNHLVFVDKDLSNIWLTLNKFTPYLGASGDTLATNSSYGYQYIAAMDGIPTGTPTNYTGHTALVYSIAASKFYMYNTSDNSWRTLAVGTSGYQTKIIDNDGDTKVDVEESSDEDIIRMDSKSVEVFTSNNSQCAVSLGIKLGLSGYNGSTYWIYDYASQYNKAYVSGELRMEI